MGQTIRRVHKATTTPSGATKTKTWSGGNKQKQGGTTTQEVGGRKNKTRNKEQTTNDKEEQGGQQQSLQLLLVRTLEKVVQHQARDFQKTSSTPQLRRNDLQHDDRTQTDMAQQHAL